MIKKQRFFSPEFKQEAASLRLDQVYSFAQACTSLGMSESALRRWAKQLNKECEGITPRGKALTPEQRLIKELEASCNRLKREKDILKKATSLLMSDEMSRTR